MNTTEAKRAELRALKKAVDAPWDPAVMPTVRRHIDALTKHERAKSKHFDDLLDDIDEITAALRRLAEADKLRNGPCMTADDACPCAQCETGRIGE